MESQVGIEIVALVLKPETKKKLFDIRNQYIANGETNYTLGDVITKAVNCLETVETYKQKAGEAKNAGSGSGASEGK